MIERPAPTLFAHRGASAFAPENTLAAFQLASEHGADGVELDAKLTADGEVVVIHDQTVDRTTDGTGRVTRMTLAELQVLDAGAKFGAQFAGERIPTLESVFETTGKRLLINIELTNYSTPNDRLVDEVAAKVRRHALEDWVVFSSFHPVSLLKARRLLPSVPAYFLLLPGWGHLSRLIFTRWISPHGFNPYFTDINATMIADAHARGQKVNAWTVNEEKDMRNLASWAVDGIITDNPRLARRVLEEA